jgi:DinB superfamily
MASSGSSRRSAKHDTSWSRAPSTTALVHMSGPEAELRRALSTAHPRLVDFTDAAAGIARAPGKWSRKQIIGHLIDSASVNHERFVRAQLTEDLICPPYDQNAWVASQGYHAASWPDLVALFTQLNLHIANVMEACPVDARERPRSRHNLDQVAFRTPLASKPVTLEFFMRDYVAHLEHHLAQILD